MGANRPTCDECRPQITARAAEAFELFQLCLPSFSPERGIDYAAIEVVLRLSEVEEKSRRRLFELILCCFGEFLKMQAKKQIDISTKKYYYMVQ